MSFNGSSKSIKLLKSSRFPQMQDPIKRWVRALVFDQIITRTEVFETVETKVRKSARGVWQPFSSQQLRTIPEGQRAWSWFMVHTLTDLELNIFDRIVFEGQTYRVMQKKDYHLNAYYEYAVIFDYQYEVPDENEQSVP